MGLIVTNTGTKPIRHLSWGLEGPLTYDPATSLSLDSDSLVTTGFAGSQATTSGAYDLNATGNNVVFAYLTTSGQHVAVCGLGDLTHKGAFRIVCRMQATVGTKVRLSWRVGDGSLTVNDWAAAKFESTWEELDLGMIDVQTLPSGAHRWTGQIEVLAAGTGGVHVDHLLLIPVTDGYGKARAVYSYSPGVMVGHDEFTGTTAGVALNGRVAPAGGTWATSGAATDFAFADEATLGEVIARSTVSDASGRFAILGTGTFTDAQVETLLWNSLPPGVSGASLEHGVIARWTDSSNYLRGVVKRTAGTPPTSGTLVRTLEITQVVAGVTTILGSVSFPQTYGSQTLYGVRLIAFASGRAILQLLDATRANTLVSVEATGTALATGGAIASGKAGLYDLNTSSTSIVRYYDDVEVSTPAAESVVIWPGRTLEVSGEDVIRQDSTGVYTGRPPSYRGSRFRAPVGTSRVVVHAAYEDLEIEASSTTSVPITVQVSYEKRGLVVPR